MQGEKIVRDTRYARPAEPESERCFFSANPGLRPLRGLTRGYYLSPLPGLENGLPTSPNVPMADLVSYRLFMSSPADSRNDYSSVSKLLMNKSNLLVAQSFATVRFAVAFSPPAAVDFLF
jgi:hypothetical protein